MTPTIARNQRKLNFSGFGLFSCTLRRGVVMKRKRFGGRRTPQQSIAAAPVSSWICTSTSWTNVEGSSVPFEDDFEGELEEVMKLFTEWTIDDDEEVMVEPETHDSLLMAALLSKKELLPLPSAGLLRTLSCPDLKMGPLAILLFATPRRPCHCNSLPPTPTKWFPALEPVREMDPPNSLASTVSLPSGWDAVSARLSSSSIFNVFSDPIPSLFSIDPTGVDTGSTVSVPASFWDTPSTVSQVGSSTDAYSLTSSTSSLFPDPSEVPSSSSSIPTSCDCCGCLDPDWPAYGYVQEQIDEVPSPDASISDDEGIEEDFIEVDSAPSACLTDAKSVPMDMATTVSVTTQTEAEMQTSTARMLAECNEMIEKLTEMKKRLEEMM